MGLAVFTYKADYNANMERGIKMKQNRTKFFGAVRQKAALRRAAKAKADSFRRSAEIACGFCAISYRIDTRIASKRGGRFL